MPSKRKRDRTRPETHPRNKYSDNPPDFALLASLYPTFEPFVSYTRDGWPRIDWTDFDATRELTRVLLLHDHGLTWWIPDGQLCPTVPNRSNYIHWIEDLLSSDIIPSIATNRNGVKGFDIGTGANCIYPLLGASLLGWSFVGSDVTDIALEWAEKNVKNNPHISELIEIRKAGNGDIDESGIKENKVGESEASPPSSSQDQLVDTHEKYRGAPILLDVVKDGESFDFCMCNPPFFESMEESGLNPKTSCGGTPQEMVCPGGEKAFISRIIEDSVVLKQSFRWYTSMVGRKTNIKPLTSKLREVGVTIVKTTEFVQGQTCRWGIAWSFVPPTKKIIVPRVAVKNSTSFMLESRGRTSMACKRIKNPTNSSLILKNIEFKGILVTSEQMYTICKEMGLERQSGAIDVLQSVDSFFQARGDSSKLNVTSFTVDITSANDHNDSTPKSEAQRCEEAGSSKTSSSLTFRVSVFQQIPGTLLVKGSLHKDCSSSGAFTLEMQQLEEFLRSKFCRNKRA